jgi:hypothetical protein
VSRNVAGCPVEARVGVEPNPIRPGQPLVLRPDRVDRRLRSAGAQRDRVLLAMRHQSAQLFLECPAHFAHLATAPAGGLRGALTSRAPCADRTLRAPVRGSPRSPSRWSTTPPRPSPLTDRPPRWASPSTAPDTADVGVAGHRRHQRPQGAQANADSAAGSAPRNLQRCMTPKRSSTRHPEPDHRHDPIRPGGPPRADPIPLTRRFTGPALPRHPIDRNTAGAGLAESPGTLRPTLHSRLAEPRRRASAPRCQRSRRLDAERPSEVPTDGDPRSRCRRAFNSWCWRTDTHRPANASGYPVDRERSGRRRRIVMRSRMRLCRLETVGSDGRLRSPE